MRDIKLGLLGLGNVGKGVWEILHNNHKITTDYANANLVIKRVLVRDPNKNRGLSIPYDVFTTEADGILHDPEIDIVVELIGGIHPAYEYIKEAIQNGKHVVTANKAVIANFGAELLEMAARYGVELYFEGSVGGGIPIIATLQRSLAANRIQRIVGIINGTTNYILTRMTRDGMSFAQALKQAQEKGYAEADPTSDIEGEDAAFKLSILAYIAFGVQIAPDELPRVGITKISEKEIEYAEQLGYTIKLLATAEKRGDFLETHVHPALVPGKHPLASVSDEYNALFIKGDAVGELMLYGRGAGSLATGSAVMGDILEIARLMMAGMAGKLDGTKKKQPLTVVGEGCGAYYVRLQVVDKPGVLGRITTTFGKYEISLESVVQKGQGEETVPLVFVTHRVERAKLDAALYEISQLPVVSEVASILRVERFD